MCTIGILCIIGRVLFFVCINSWDIYSANMVSRVMCLHYLFLFFVVYFFFLFIIASIKM